MIKGIVGLIEGDTGVSTRIAGAAYDVAHILGSMGVSEKRAMARVLIENHMDLLYKFLDNVIDNLTDWPMIIEEAGSHDPVRTPEHALEDLRKHLGGGL